MAGRLEGRAAIITGATSGIGEATARRFVEEGASLVIAGRTVANNASVAAHRAGQGGLLYSASKAAVSQLTHLAAVELGPRNIRVNAISPGAIATPIFWGGSSRANQLSEEENSRKLAKLEQNLARATPLPRTGYALDIANAALFLASDEGSFVNGHDLVVDGGRIWQFHERLAH
jgi:NAD(P)-dependent dehydrogenase (short-subunit alcohol dehydrogenase family)